MTVFNGDIERSGAGVGIQYLCLRSWVGAGANDVRHDPIVVERGDIDTGKVGENATVWWRNRQEKNGHGRIPFVGKPDHLYQCLGKNAWTYPLPAVEPEEILMGKTLDATKGWWTEQDLKQTYDPVWIRSWCAIYDACLNDEGIEMVEAFSKEFQFAFHFQNGTAWFCALPKVQSWNLATQ